MHRVRTAAVDALDQRREREAADFGARLVDRRQRHMVERREERVVVADDRDVGGNAQACVLEAVERARGHEVVRGEDCRRQRIFVE